MTGAAKRKQPIIYVSSSSDNGEEFPSDSESESPSESDPDYSDDEFSGGCDADSGSGATTDGDSDAEADSGECDCKSGGDDDETKGNMSDEDLCKRVIDLLQKKKSLDNLKLQDCRAYLRKHGLRISGTKATCVQRILEHWRIKDGIGENLYPRSSFHINCTGDVCKGDTIMFWQRVYEKYDKVTRGGGKPIGRRTIAGRIVKESYGEQKQQHTFTVEVLWSKGVKALLPLQPLRVKGRNLYRMRTFRQSWTNERERVEVLAEKHKRGAAARHIRGIAKAREAHKGLNPKKRTSNRNVSLNQRTNPNTKHETRKVKRKSTDKSLPAQGNGPVKAGGDQAPIVKPSKLKKNTGKGLSTHQQPSEHPFKGSKFPSNEPVKNKHVLKERNQASIVTTSKMPANEHTFNAQLGARQYTSMSQCLPELSNPYGSHSLHFDPRIRPLHFHPRSSMQLYAAAVQSQFDPRHDDFRRHPYLGRFQLHPRHPY